MADATEREHDERAVRTATEVAIRLSAIALLALWCLLILAPFLGIVVWAVIIAVAASAPYERIVGVCGRRRGLAATLCVLLALMLLAVPAVLLSETLVTGAEGFAEKVQAGDLEIPPPPERIASVPLVGDRIHKTWLQASENLPGLVERLEPQLLTVSRWLLSAAGSAGIALLQLIASLIISGVILARSQAPQAAGRLASRLAGDRGRELMALTQASIRSVVQGIVGVAVIQALLAGAGFLAAGVPAAGLWALLVLVAAVIQLPVVLVVLPPVLLVFSQASTTVAVMFAVWCLFVSLIDNVLKPILFGRGAQVPTVVIFLGAIGGMLTMGILGLFVGAVVLSLGFEIFQAWVSPETVDEAVSAA